MSISKRTTKVILTFVMALLLTLVLVACDDGEVVVEKFSVEFVMDGGSPQIAAQEVEKDAKVTKPNDPAKVGFEFTGWYRESNLTNEWRFNIDVVTSDIKLYAGWEVEEEPVVDVKFTVTFNANGGEVVDETVEVVEGNLVANPTAIRDGYNLVGWFSDVDLTVQWDFANDKVTEDVTLYAKWDIDKTADGTAITSQNEFYDLIRGETQYESGAKFFLEFDLDFTGFNWAQSGFEAEGAGIHNFNFEGNGKTISNLDIVASDHGAVIPRMNGGSVSNLTLTNINVTGGSQGGNGILIGRVMRGSSVELNNIVILDSKLVATREGAAALVGSLQGQLSNDVMGSTVTANNIVILNVDIESANHSVGGVFGEVQSSTASLKDALIEVKVKSSLDRVGGIIGQINKHGSTPLRPEVNLENVIVKADVTGTQFLGGISGRSDSNLVGESAGEFAGPVGSFKNIIMIVNIESTLSMSDVGTDKRSGLLGRGNLNEPVNTWGVAFNHNFDELTGQSFDEDALVGTIAELPETNLAPFAEWQAGTLLPKLLGYELPELYLVELTTGEKTINQYVTDGRNVMAVAYDEELGVFKNWLLDGEVFEGPVTESVKLVAEFTAVHTVSFNYNDESPVSEVSVFDGELLEEPVEPTKDGYKFLGWFTDESVENLYHFETPVTANLTLYAGWEDLGLEEFTVTFDTNGGSVIEPVTVVQGLVLELTLNPTKANSIFKGWFTDVDLTEEYDFNEPVNSDFTLYARWEATTLVGTAIYNATEFMAFLENTSGEYYLAEDINLSEEVYSTTGNGPSFGGTLNGNNKTISGLTINGEDRVGLFPTANGATIENLTIDGFVVTGTGRGGILIGRVENNLVTLSNITIRNSSIVGNNSNGVGGLIGQVSNKVNASLITLENLEITNVNKNVGGLVGRIDSAAGDLQASEVLINNIYIVGTAGEGDRGASLVVGYIADDEGAKGVLHNIAVINSDIKEDTTRGVLIGYNRSPGYLEFNNVYVDITFTEGSVKSGLQGHTHSSSNPIYLDVTSVFGTFINGNDKSGTVQMLPGNIMPEEAIFADWLEVVLPTIATNPFFAALFEEPVITHRVSFESNGGSSVASMQVAPGSLLEDLTIPTRDGFEFNGWFKDELLTEEWLATDVVEDDLTLFAKWLDISNPTIVVTPEQGEQELLPGNSFVLTVQIVDNAPYSLEVDHNLDPTLEFTVYANAADPYGTVEEKAKFDSQGVVVTYDEATQTFSIDFGVTLSHNVLAEEGVTFYLVARDETGNASGSMDPTTPENTFAYTFSVPTTLYTVTLEGNGATSLEKDVLENVVANSTVDLPVPSKLNASFTGWFKDVELTELWLEEDVVTADMTLYAGWGAYQPVAGSVAISSAEDFRTILDANKSGAVHLTSDLDFTGVSYETISSSFAGILDGAGFAIRNLTIDGGDRAGLFNYINAGVVKNLTFDNVSVTSTGGRAGVIAGVARNADLKLFENLVFNNVSVTGSKNEGVGLIAGDANGSITVSNVVVSNSSVANTNRAAGALFGRLQGIDGTPDLEINISNVFIESINIEAPSRIGALIGDFSKAIELNIDNVVANVILVDGSGGNVGGLIGKADGSIRELTTISNVLVDVTYDAVATGMGYLYGESNSSITTDNAFVIPTLNGTVAPHNNGMNAANVLDGTELTLSSEWFDTNLPTIANSPLWVYNSVLNSFVLVIGVTQ